MGCAVGYTRPNCLHCLQFVASRPRGLCWTCYYTPGVREQYGPVDKFGGRGSGLENGQGKLPAEPTDFPPGSDGKILVMQARAARGESLFHPDDATFGTPGEDD